MLVRTVHPFTFYVSMLVRAMVGGIMFSAFTSVHPILMNAISVQCVNAFLCPILVKMMYQECLERISLHWTQTSTWIQG